MPQEEITIFAQTNFRNQKAKFGIKTDDRRRHFYVLGKTGMGKTNLLETMIIQDIQRGKGVAVVDPHGELVENILRFIPNRRINDVIYFNPSDINFPIAFNVLEQVSPEHRHLVASGLLGVFQKIWADSWGPRLEYVLNNAILALLEYPGSTLLGIMKILVDKNFRQKVVRNLSDPVVKSFWVDEYSNYPDRFQSEAIAPIQNKVGRFLSSSMMRNIVGQVKSTIDMRKIMDEEKILLLNLSKGRIGEDNSALLGAMMVTKMQLAAMSRVEMPESERRDFYLYVDEFQNFATDSFANILSEARKYRLNLILAHQYIEQLSDTVRAAVFGNVGTLICFRVGAEDAEFLVKEFTPRFEETDLVNLGKYNVYLKLMIDGLASEPFSATSLPPETAPEDYAEVVEKVIKVTRERYTTKREIIEEKITRWSGLNHDKETPLKTEKRIFPEKKPWPAAKTEKPKEAKDKKTSLSVICDSCKNSTTINFVPDPTKPIYCKDCLKKIRQAKIIAEPAGPSLAERVLSQNTISLKQALNLPVKDFKNHKNKNEVYDSGRKIEPGETVNF